MFINKIKKSTISTIIAIPNNPPPVGEPFDIKFVLWACIVNNIKKKSEKYNNSGSPINTINTIIKPPILSRIYGSGFKKYS